MYNDLVRRLGMCFCIFMLTLAVAAQHAPQGETSSERFERERQDQRIKQNVEESFDGLRKISGQSVVVSRGPFSTKDRKRIIRAFEEEALPGETERLSPDQTYFDQFADFLKDKNAGLALLYPDQGCDQGKTVNVQEIERCADFLPIRGGGSFYSFRNRTNLNNNGTWADIHFIDGRLVFGGRMLFGMVRNIGDIDLEKLSINSPQLKFLRKYKPKKKSSALEQEGQKLARGQLDSFAASAAVLPNSTYILRSVAFRHRTFYSLDNRVDVIVAFRVIAHESDGSLVLLWRELRSRQSPQLKLD